LISKPTVCAQKRNVKVLCVMRSLKNQSQLKKQPRRLLLKKPMVMPAKKLQSRRLLQKKLLPRKLLQKKLSQVKPSQVMMSQKNLRLL
jgi:hypothetical protein